MSCLSKIYNCLFPQPQEKLYVITTIFNPKRFNRRWKLYKDFEEYVLNTENTVLVTVECEFGERPFRVEKRGNNHIVVQVRAKDELWLKENLTNIGIQHLPCEAKYIAWIDADITFARPDWVSETIHLLQHYDVIQMFKYAIDLDADYNPYQTNRGFVANYLDCIGYSSIRKDKDYCGGNWHPGYAWAAKRKVIDDLGGLLDFCIGGAADRHMANALIGSGLALLPDNIHKEYKDRILEWQEKCKYIINKNIGYMSGLLLHQFHGSKRYRRYEDRWFILTKNNYQPSKDIILEDNGVYSLAPHAVQIRDALRRYFSERNEDDLSLRKEENKF